MRFEHPCLKLTAQLIRECIFKQKNLDICEASIRFPQFLIQKIYLVCLVFFFFLELDILTRKSLSTPCTVLLFLLFRIPGSYPQPVHGMFIASSPNSLGMKERVFWILLFSLRKTCMLSVLQESRVCIVISMLTPTQMFVGFEGFIVAQS